MLETSPRQRRLEDVYIIYRHDERRGVENDSKFDIRGRKWKLPIY